MIRLSTSSSTTLPSALISGLRRLSSPAARCEPCPMRRAAPADRRLPRRGPTGGTGSTLPQAGTGPLPATVDVAVVGGGYTGLAAALEIARAGRHVVVLDRDDIGAGASSRNGGMAHPGGKHDLSEFLAQPVGRRLWDETVTRLRGAGRARRRARRRVRLAAPRAISSWPTIPAWPPASAPSPLPTPRIGEEARFVDAAELRAEIGSDRFYGGLLVVDAAPGSTPPSWRPAWLGRPPASGAELHGATTVLRCRAPGTGVRRSRRRGARCGAARSWWRPTARPIAGSCRGWDVGSCRIGSYMIATEPLDPDVAASVNPHGRMFFDTRNLLHYWRLSPDGTRVLFGGRTSLAPTTVERSRDQLYGAMVDIHPQLAGVRVERAWGGRVALTADRFPHVGRHPGTGVVYAMGYCGSGVALSVHFGRAVGRWLCGDGDPAGVRRQAVAADAVARPCAVAPGGGRAWGSRCATRWDAERTRHRPRAAPLIRRRWRRTRRRRRRTGRCGPPRAAPRASTAPRCPGS